MASNADERRTSLAQFLRARRQQVLRSTLGLPPGPRGRLSGLAREEVVYHAAVSMTWYTWLEQAREIQPSREVMVSVARALQLDDRETDYVLQLAGYASPAREAHLGSGRAPASVQRLMDALDPNPAYAIFPDWFVAGWNSAYEAMFPRVAEVPLDARNLLHLVYTEPSVRRLLPDWDLDAHRFLAEFRAEAGPYLSHPGVSRLIGHLLETSEEFRVGWRTEDLELFSVRSRRFDHPSAGPVRLEHHRLTPNDHPDLVIVLYTPGDAESAAALRSAAEATHGR